jgi:hypothetical protein
MLFLILGRIQKRNPILNRFKNILEIIHKIGNIPIFEKWKFSLQANSQK